MPDQAIERKLLSDGFNHKQRSFLLGICKSTTHFLQQPITFYVHYKQYAKQLTVQTNSVFITIKHAPIKTVLKSHRKPLIVYMDMRIFGNETHSPHFVVVEYYNNTLYRLFDPWTGEVTMINVHIVKQAIHSLRTHLLFSPIAITAA